MADIPSVLCNESKSCDPGEGSVHVCERESGHERQHVCVVCGLLWSDVNTPSDLQAGGRGPQ